jgi:hypothetical protein
MSHGQTERIAYLSELIEGCHDQSWEGELQRSCVDDVRHAVQAVWHAQGSSRGDRASRLLLHSTTAARCTGRSPQAGMRPSAARCAQYSFPPMDMRRQQILFSEPLWQECT